ncbi:MAG: type II toxin-antitoxin system death-on-curing family toxin [Candidatus Micrarchaeota archaeon]
MATKPFNNVEVREIIAFNKEALEAEGQRQGAYSIATLEFVVEKFERKYSTASTRESLAGICATAIYDIAHRDGRHPFYDGNKRTALLTMQALLGLNGFRLAYTKRSAKMMLKKAACGKIFHRQIGEWISKRMTEVSNGGLKNGIK